MSTKYPIHDELSIPEEANKRNADLTFSEVRKEGSGHRVIGGDKGDLHHEGYTVEEGKTVLYKPVLVTTYEDLTEEEAFEFAQEILMFSYEAIGTECLL